MLAGRDASTGRSTGRRARARRSSCATSGRRTRTSIETYKAGGGYANLKKYLSLKPEEIVETVKKSSLRGRGGAGFPTGLKWSFLPKDNPKPRYLCVNADESEPGTYKDRLIIEKDPHQLIEATVVSAYAIRVEDLLHLHPRRVPRGHPHRSRRRVDEAYAAGYVGKNILGTGVDVDIVVHGGAGAYECGEETALLESLEGKRGQPRLQAAVPGRPAGLYSCPTIVNNVETIACVPLDPRARAGVVRVLRHREERRSQALLRQRPREAARHLRGAHGQDHAAPAHRGPALRRRHPRRAAS